MQDKGKKGSLGIRATCDSDARGGVACNEKAFGCDLSVRVDRISFPVIPLISLSARPWTQGMYYPSATVISSEILNEKDLDREKFVANSGDGMRRLHFTIKFTYCMSSSRCVP